MQDKPKPVTPARVDALKSRIASLEAGLGKAMLALANAACERREIKARLDVLEKGDT